MITLAQLQRIAPQAGPALAFFVAPLADAMEHFEISTPVRQAAFLAQVAHESAGFTRMVENLNYSVDGLAATFGHRLSIADCRRLGRSPGERPLDAARQAAIANAVYANRNGNGGPETGDGWKYRGRGGIQITGRANYRECSIALFGRERALLDSPELLEQRANAVHSAAWWWWKHGLNELADRRNIAAITRTITGGSIGLDKRIALFDVAAGVLA